MVVLCCSAFCLQRAASGGKLGDESDGSRSVSVHRFLLYDYDNLKILPDDEIVMPFSLMNSCGATDCHAVRTVSRGWHFNAIDSNVPPGRVGQPWIYVDRKTLSQIPLSYRPWPGTFKPEQIGMTNREFTKLFGRQFPGAAPRVTEAGKPEEIMRTFVSGNLEINCLACHSADPRQDQAEYALQVARENFRWAAVAASGLASVTGVAADMPDTFDYKMPDFLDEDVRPPKVKYRDNIFDEKNQVFFDLVREVPNKRCYFCHSNLDADEQEWSAQEDVHLQAGLKCVDCHRNGIAHNMTRGYEHESTASVNPLADTLTCESCHINNGDADEMTGQLGAPIAKHEGIPPIHFDKLTCTACHSGRWPERKTVKTKTSRAHALGTLNVNKSDDALPHIIYPVFAEQQGIAAGYRGGLLVLSSDGKIAPQKLVWPAYWGKYENQKVFPLKIETVRPVASQVVSVKSLPTSGTWPDLTKDGIKKILLQLSDTIGAEAVYIAGGKLYRLDGDGNLTADRHQAAEPYHWPIAHNVRPAAQSLGVNRCEDCHSTRAGLCFGKVEIDTPVSSEKGQFRDMFEFQDVDPLYSKLFAITFVFRPWLKVVAVVACLIIAAVILLYVLKAIGFITKSISEGE